MSFQQPTTPSSYEKAGENCQNFEQISPELHRILHGIRKELHLLLTEMGSLLSSTPDTLHPHLVVEKWLKTPPLERTVEKAQEILKPFETYGTIIASDDSGSSKAAAQAEKNGTLDIFQSLAPHFYQKKCIRNIQSYVGMTPYGSWAADNTHTFYEKKDQHSEIEHSIHVIGVLKLIHSTLQHPDITLKTSFGAHYGKVYKIGNSLIGRELQAIEHIAENEVPAGEIWMSKALVKHFFHLVETPTKTCSTLEKLYPLNTSRIKDLLTMLPDTLTSDSHFPHSLSKSVAQRMNELTQNSANLQNISEKDFEDCEVEKQQKYVLFIKVGRRNSTGHLSEEAPKNNAELLNHFAHNHVFGQMSKKVTEALGGEYIKQFGELALITANNLESALKIAYSIRTGCNELGMSSSIGIDFGDILYFASEVPHGQKDIAGLPVNLASKLAEDESEADTIYITENARTEKGRYSRHISGTPSSVTQSGVPIDVIKL